MLTEVDIEERKAAGRKAAEDQQATERKPLGQTAPDAYPYSYWYIVGYNEAVDARAKAKKGKK